MPTADITFANNAAQHRCEAMLDDARALQLHVIPVCQFIAGYIRKHPDYVDLVRDDIRRAFKI